LLKYVATLYLLLTNVNN